MRKEETNNRAGNRSIISKLVIKMREKLKIIDIGEVEYIKSEGCYSEVVTAGGEKYVVSRPLGYYEKLLSGYSFVRVHKCYMVNLNRVEEIVSNRGIKLKLTGGAEVPVSMYKKSEILNMYVY